MMCKLAIWQRLMLLLAVAWLTGCSTTLRSEVRTQHDWARAPQEKTYQFAAASAAPPEANATSSVTAATASGVVSSSKRGVLSPSVASDDEREVAQEYQHALNLLRHKLQGLGFREVAAGAPANLTVALQYSTVSQPIYQLDDVLYAPHNRFWFNRWGMPGMPYVRGGRHHAIYYGPYFGTGYGPYIGPSIAPSLWYYPGFGFDPLFRGGPVYVYRESAFPNYQRQLRVLIEQNADHKKLYEVQVANESRSDAIEHVLPFMLDSAFNGFPGESGSVRVVEVKFD